MASEDGEDRDDGLPLDDCPTTFYLKTAPVDGYLTAGQPAT